jgi:hypothetical protein
MLMTAMIFGARTYLIVIAKRRANSFAADGNDVSPFMQRLSRAHANLYESAIWCTGLLLLALTTKTTFITEPLALIFLLARIFQSGIHIASTEEWAVKIRFSFFLIQFVIAVNWIIQFVHHFQQ